MAVIALFIIYLSRESSDWTWFTDYQYLTKLFGITLSFIYIGISIEKTSFFKIIWNFGFSKFIISIAISAIILFSSGKASELINLVFNVDASAFPYTRAYIVGLLVFQYTSPFLVIIACFYILHSIDIWYYIKKLINRNSSYYTEVPYLSILFLISSITFLLFSYNWVKRDFSEDAYPSKIYRLAHILDFNSKHPCLNINKNTKVIFLDSAYNKVLVDENNIKTKNIESFINKDSSKVFIPKKFNIVFCKID
ncbi:hypothetical protein [Limnobaculum xujianqingii]|uniref:hypothetical protein n=1 Tax=Limnobaculum xujianqingii TaxID=2738837 RepID=UPI001C4DD17B|nr:hypothetical protein [Limnobaculum xujianqingii]